MSDSSFVSEMRPLTVIMSVLGWIPSHGNSVMVVRVLSWKFCYSVCLITLQLGTALQMLFATLQWVPTLSSDNQNIAYIFLFAKTFPHLVPLCVLIQAQHQAHFCNVWVLLQSKIEKYGMSGQPLVLNLKLLVLRRVFFILLLTCSIFALRLWKFQQLPILHNVSLVLGFINESLVFTWWHYSCEATRAVSARLLQEFTLLLEYNETGKTRLLLSEAVLGLRSPWLQLCRVMQIFGDPLSLVQSFIVTVSFGRMLFAGYVMCTTGDPRVSGFYASLFIISVSSLTIVCQATHRLEQEIRRDLLHAIQKLKKLRISEPARKTFGCSANVTSISVRSVAVVYFNNLALFIVYCKMTRFLLHLIRKCPEITLSGYIRVGRHLLAHLVTAYVTYIVLIIQLQVGAKPITFEQLEEMFNATMH